MVDREIIEFVYFRNLLFYSKANITFDDVQKFMDAYEKFIIVERDEQGIKGVDVYTQYKGNTVFLICCMRSGITDGFSIMRKHLKEKNAMFINRDLKAVS